MTNKITNLTAATIPTTGTDVLWIEQGALAKKITMTELKAEVGGGATIDNTWNFDDVITAANPGANNFRLDNGTLASVTNIYINDTTLGGADAGTLFSFMQAEDRIYVQQESDVVKSAVFRLSGVPVDNSGWWTIPVTVDGSATIMDDAAKCGLLFHFNEPAGAGVTQLDGLSDVTSAAVTDKFALMADGAAYVGRAIVGADVSDLAAAVAATASVTANTAKVSNVTHTGEVTGSTTLSLANSAISGQSALTSGLSGTDELLISDGGTIKRMDVSVMNSYFNSNLNFAATSHNHAAADVNSGTFVDGRITSSSVTQHLGDYANWTTSGQNDGQMTISTSAASGGANGDIHFRYT